MSEEEFDAEAELKKYDDTPTTVFYWSDATSNRTLNSLRNAATHLKENPGKGPLAELIAHTVQPIVFSLVTSSRPSSRLFRNFLWLTLPESFHYPPYHTRGLHRSSSPPGALNVG